ncbi:MAG: photosystem II reaction center PsbP family protein [Lachnospiraceae bacterium]|nr:photosystem II reaction center PsbP family protein [Lachnospiraceae bacterium]
MSKYERKVISSFKDMVDADIRNVFLNTAEFAETHTIVYDGVTYADIPALLTRPTLEERTQLAFSTVSNDGLYKVTAMLHCHLADIGGALPERGAVLKCTDGDGTAFLRRYYVETAVREMGMCHLELRAFDE